MKFVAAFLLFLTVSCEIKPAEALQAELPLRSLEVSYDKSFPVSLDPKPAYDYFTGKIYVFGGARFILSTKKRPYWSTKPPL